VIWLNLIAIRCPARRVSPAEVGRDVGLSLLERALAVQYFDAG
jgi:hypothetical protein